MLRKHLDDLARDFWECAGEELPFPRDLTAIVSLLKPVAVKRMAGLSVASIQSWLRSKGQRFHLVLRDRRLNGCLAAFRGQAFVFLEATLREDDARMIAAHEVAHFLADYESPRATLCRRLGPALLEVLDGVRPASPAERLAATLSGVSSLAAHVHYMERGESGTYNEPTCVVERTANELGLELVAPWRAVVREMESGPGRAAALTDWIAMLRSRFGLPENWARPYARRLLRFVRATRPFSEALGLG